MFFVVSKIVGFFAIPSNLVISIGIVGLLLLPTRFARAGRRLAFASLILLAIARPVADRQCVDHSAGRALSGLECRGRPAGRHRRARRARSRRTCRRRATTWRSTRRPNG